MANDAVLELTDANFDAEVVNGDQPVLVDFWAEWCMPCRMLAPVIDELALEYQGKIKVAKVDTDANKDAAMKHSISALPTILLFNKGEVVHKFVGMTPKDAFKAELDKVTG